jgi:hypothetical protein
LPVLQQGRQAHKKTKSSCKAHMGFKCCFSNALTRALKWNYVELPDRNTWISEIPQFLTGNRNTRVYFRIFFLINKKKTGVRSMAWKKIGPHAGSEKKC